MIDNRIDRLRSHSGLRLKSQIPAVIASLSVCSTGSIEEKPELRCDSGYGIDVHNGSDANGMDGFS